MVNTPLTRQMEAQKQLLDFVDHAQPGTRFALFANMAGMHLVQGFTSDHTLLRAAILSKGPGPHLPNVFLYGDNYGYEDAGAVLSNLKFLAEYLNGISGQKEPAVALERVPHSGRRDDDGPQLEHRCGRGIFQFHHADQ